MTVGLAAAVFSTFVGANTGYSLIVSDLFHNVLRRKQDGAGTESPGRLPAFRWRCCCSRSRPYTFW